MTADPSPERRPMLGETSRCSLVDHGETMGPAVMAEFVRGLAGLQTVVDVGAGKEGRDLKIVREHHPKATLVAVEASRLYARRLAPIADQVVIADVERDPLPFADVSVDLVIANQVIEHTKEVFWIFHEITRTLRVGGHFILGVPNICSLHNRLLMLLGEQPTQHKLCSGHVRPFSKRDTIRSFEDCFPGGYRLVAFRGAQFYPFPKPIARPLARMFPTFAFSIFFLFRKLRDYRDEFATYPERAYLETKFWTGNRPSTFEY